MTIINIFTENIFPDWDLDEKDVIEKTRMMLEFFILTLKEKSCLKNYEYESITLDIVFCDSEKTHELNRDYRDKDKPADIITFAIFADDDMRFVFDGDISCSKNKEQELFFLISHGLMHLLGFDHQSEDEYNFVINEQRKALESINYDKI